MRRRVFGCFSKLVHKFCTQTLQIFLYGAELFDSNSFEDLTKFFVQRLRDVTALKFLICYRVKSIITIAVPPVHLPGTGAGTAGTAETLAI